MEPPVYFSCDWGTTRFRLRRVNFSSDIIEAEQDEPTGAKIFFEKGPSCSAAARERMFEQFFRERLTLLWPAALTTLEIAMNTSGATSQIRAAVEAGGDHLQVGAGTVTNLELLDAALEAGATFIVTPTVQRPVIQQCARLGVPVFPGAFSPTEILEAWDAGATMVKVFPADALGPAYIRGLKAPLPHVRLMPTGGIDLATLATYCQAGADGFGIGSPIFNAERIRASDWDGLRGRCAAFVQAYRSAWPSVIRSVLV